MSVEPKAAPTIPAHSSTGAPGPNLEAAARREFLWKTLERYDTYVGTTLTRAATVTALNTLIVGYVILKAGDILVSFGGHVKLHWLAFVSLGAGGIAAFVSTFISFLAIAPYLGPKQPKNSSLIFFMDVATRDVADFVKSIEGLGCEVATRDLATQVHDVATGLKKKFDWLLPASWSTLAGLVAMLILGISVLASEALK